MMKRALTIALGTIALLGPLATHSEADVISMFANSTYVDTAEEGANLQATLVALGHTVNTFTGITAADFAAATAGGAILVFPEMEIGDLYSDLDAAAGTFLTAFVSGGGGMIQANYYVANSSLPNGLFGYSLTQQGTGATSLDAAAAAGTPFAGGPALAPGSDAVEGILSSSLPVGALNIYHNGTETSVFATEFGLGHYVYLGFDWFEEPTPGEWEKIAGAAVDYVSTQAVSVPEPASLLLIGTGFAFVFVARRYRRQA